ncbi:hypothetical protein E1A91_A12G181200v1 [Gossypium mustelinum]|uniref:Uncharacterized protein n=1 Tax=Gossypium mustelinum TaxID=34275 RepID=A0A5D2WVR0_GOSMU|nr:hypothetical protein E1A91_A12G181200v1 [Gossypium mustelinum]
MKSSQLPPFTLMSGDGASLVSVAPPSWASGRRCSRGTFRRQGDRRRRWGGQRREQVTFLLFW